MTPSCKEVWDAIKELSSKGVDTKKLEDTFCDFECGWKQHADKFHTEKEVTIIRNTNDPTIHVHVWDHQEDVNNPVEELDLKLTGVYDDHLQFSGQVVAPAAEGTLHLHIEARVLFDDIPKLVSELLKQYAHSLGR